ncbi:MAG: hypothetical protein ACFB22_03360 [Rhodothalassiaceae bacterium]
MMPRLIFLILLLAFALAVPALAQQDELAQMAPLVGKTWRSEGVDDQGKSMVDVSRWEWILGGRAIRIVHSLNQGAYGGQTTVYPDPKGDGFRFHYVTTGGFVTEGRIAIEGGVMTATEAVTGHPEITQVKSISRLVDGVLQSRSHYLRNGEWIPGLSFDDREAPEAEPVFDPIR